MAQINTPIKIGNFWTNLVDSTTGESVNYEEVTTWWDGTPMDDSKADGEVYRKLPSTAGGGYVRRVYDNFGQLFLEKDTMLEMRDLSSTEILLIQIGRYKGVKLNGYYDKGDTPTPIEYLLSETLENDDGGSVIEVGGVKLEHVFIDVLDIRHFGANAQLTDNNEFITAATNYASNNPNLTLTWGGGTFTTSETITVPPGTHVNGGSRILSSAQIAIEIGDTITRNSRIRILITSVRRVGGTSDWLDASNIGVLIHNLYESSQVYINESYDFTTGVKFLASGPHGFVYNVISVDRIVNSRYQLVLSNIDGGWCNENLFNVNRLANNTGLHSDKSRYGIVLTSDDNNYYNNNNVFIKPSIELGSFPGVETVAILLEYAQYNTFKEVRNEFNTSGLNGAKIVKINNESHSNFVDFGFSTSNSSASSSFLEEGVYQNTIGNSLRLLSRTPINKPVIYNVDNISDKISQYDSTLNYASGHLYFFVTSDTTRRDVSTGITKNGDYIELIPQRGIGVTVDTLVNKQFLIIKKLAESSPSTGRVVIRCYDINGNVLDNSVKNHVRGAGARNFSYSASNFSGWRSSADNDNDFITVSDETVKIDIILSNGTGAIHLTGFTIYSVDKISNVLDFKGDQLVYNGASTPPTQVEKEGTVYSSKNNSNGALGFIYNNGTWELIPSIASQSEVDAGTDDTKAVTPLKLEVKLSGVLNQGALTSPASEQAVDTTDIVAKYNALQTRFEESIAKLNQVITK